MHLCFRLAASGWCVYQFVVVFLNYISVERNTCEVITDSECGVWS